MPAGLGPDTVPTPSQGARKRAFFSYGDCLASFPETWKKEKENKNFKKSKKYFFSILNKFSFYLFSFFFRREERTNTIENVIMFTDILFSVSAYFPSSRRGGM
jgi:hypothetical protein